MSDITRRAFVSSISATALAMAAAGDEWIELFNGRSLEGWRPNGNSDSWKVSDGLLVGSGPASHLFYDGKVHNAAFRNFELVAELKTTARSKLRSGQRRQSIITACCKQAELL